MGTLTIAVVGDTGINVSARIGTVELTDAADNLKINGIPVAINNTEFLTFANNKRDIIADSSIFYNGIPVAKETNTVLSTTYVLLPSIQHKVYTK